MRRFIDWWQEKSPAGWGKRRPVRWVPLALVCAAAAVMATALAATIAAASFAQAQQSAITAEAFWQQVDQTLTWLETNPPASSPDWETQAKAWEAIHAVTVTGQQTVQVDTSYIVHLLRNKPPARAKVSAYLTDLKQTRALGNHTGGERESALLRDILARPEFQDQSNNLNFIQKILQWLLDAYARLMERLFGAADNAVPIPSEVTIAISVLLITLLLVFVFRDTLSNLFNEVELAEETAGEGEILSARLANQKAQALSSAGDYRHALRYLYLSALLLLDERGLLRYNRAQTNREYLRQVRSRPDLAEHLRFVVETFDRVWYGYQPIDEVDYAAYAGHVTALEEAREAKE